MRIVETMKENTMDSMFGTRPYKIELEGRRFYYDRNRNIETVQATNPNDPDHPNYNREQVFEFLQRRAKKLYVTNDAASNGATLFVIVSHNDEMSWSQEQPIYPKQFKIYNNVYELRLRSTEQIPYRVMEYEVGTI